MATIQTGQVLHRCRLTLVMDSVPYATPALARRSRNGFWDVTVFFASMEPALRAHLYRKYGFKGVVLQISTLIKEDQPDGSSLVLTEDEPLNTDFLAGLRSLLDQVASHRAGHVCQTPLVVSHPAWALLIENFSDGFTLSAEMQYGDVLDEGLRSLRFEKPRWAIALNDVPIFLVEDNRAFIRFSCGGYDETLWPLLEGGVT